VLLLEALEDRWLPSTIGVTSTKDVLNINPTETINQLIANPPKPAAGGVTLRDCIVAANNSGPGSLINFDPLQNMTPSATINLNSPLPVITADGVAIVAQRGGAFEITINGSGAGLADGFDLNGNDCGLTALSILNFKVDGIYIQGMNATVNSCGLGIGLSNNAGANENGVVLSGAVAATLQNNDIENNTLDGIVVSQSAGIAIDNNTIEKNGADGIRVVDQMNNSGQSFTTNITEDFIQQNGANGIQLENSSNNKIGKSGALDAHKANQIGSDPYNQWEPNGGDGILIQSFGNGQTTNNEVRENVIGGNKGNGVKMTGGGTSANSLVNNLIGEGLELKDNFLNYGVLPNKLDGVAIAGGAHDNIVGGPGLFLTKNSQEGAGNIIGPNLGNGVRLSDAGTTGNTIIGNLIGTSDTGTAVKDAMGNPLFNHLFGVAITNGASDNIIGGPGQVHTGNAEGNLISGNTLGGVDVKGAGTSTNKIWGNFVGTDYTGEVKLGNGGNGVTIEQGAAGNSVSMDNLISGNTNNGVGIFDSGTTGNLVQQNQIGTDLSGTQALGNGTNGVVIGGGASVNTVGGAPSSNGTGGGNLISGNKFNGVFVQGNGIDNRVMGNVIGTDAHGGVALGNGFSGVAISANSTHVESNLISGNLLSGVSIASSQNVLLGNKIGTDGTGSAAVPNHLDGVVISVQLGSGGNMIGGPFLGTGNQISGNDGNGISISGPASAVPSLIQGNLIGTDATGATAAIPNQANGVLINNTSGYSIGGSVVTGGNVISGNAQDGVKITGALATGDFVLNNRIGTNLFGAVPLPNQGNGVDIVNGAHAILVAFGNVISGNIGDGVQISSGADGNVVRGNRIGTDVGGTYAVPNQGNGVNIFGRSLGNTIGGAGAGGENVISGNDGDGVRLAQLAEENLVEGNVIGTDITGMTTTGTDNKPLGNQQNGVEILTGSVSNKIGVVTGGGTVVGNVISGNDNAGVLIWGADKNLVQGNQIGTTKSGLAALGNLDGVDVINSSYTQIGGPGLLGAGAPNLISGNQRDGVRLFGSLSTYNLVADNLIGTDGTGKAPLGNTGHGVFLFSGPQHNVIGEGGAGNVIAFNGKAGVAVGGGASDFTTVHNPILFNSIFGNGGLGIDLGDDGVTSNSLGGPNQGPNDFQNFPDITSATVANSTTTISITLNSIHNTAFLIQVFVNSASDPSGHGQGRTLLATATLMTNGSGQGTITVTIPQNLKGQYVTATATALGNYFDTSEFGSDFLVP
jgi:parallel beta-helix repeat protein